MFERRPNELQFTSTVRYGTVWFNERRGLFSRQTRVVNKKNARKGVRTEGKKKGR